MPILILIGTKIGGPNGLFILHILMWLLSINLIYLALKYLIGNIFVSFLGVLLLVSNISLITLTFHSLTEISTVFFLSYLIYFIV